MKFTQVLNKDAERQLYVWFSLTHCRFFCWEFRVFGESLPNTTESRLLLLPTHSIGECKRHSEFSLLQLVSPSVSSQPKAGRLLAVQRREREGRRKHFVSESSDRQCLGALQRGEWESAERGRKNFCELPTCNYQMCRLGITCLQQHTL